MRPYFPTLSTSALVRAFTAELRAERSAHASFATHLARSLGRPMERALIRARQRYDALKPARVRAARLRRAYGARR